MLTITTKLPHDPYLAEIPQSCQLKMALLRKKSDTEFERLTPFVMCRDFLTDVFSFSKAKKDFSIYGMSWQGSKQSADFSGLYLLLLLPDEKTLGNLQSNLSHLNMVEKGQKIVLSTLEKVNKNHYVLQADKRWLQNCILFSLYTLLIRTFCSKEVAEKDWIVSLGKIKDNTDSALIQSIHPTTWEKVLADLSCIETEEFCGFEPTTKDISTVHHNSGFVSVFGQHREITWSVVKKNTHWKEMKKRGFTLHPKALEAA